MAVKASPHRCLHPSQGLSPADSRSKREHRPEADAPRRVGGRRFPVHERKRECAVGAPATRDEAKSLVSVDLFDC